MTTIAEFLEKTKPSYRLQKQALRWPDFNSMATKAQDWWNKTTDDFVNSAAPIVANQASKNDNSIATQGSQYLINNAVKNKVPNFIPASNQPGNKYVNLAQKLFGGDNNQKNPYLDYFQNKTDNNYSDAQFLYDLNQIIQSNPKVGSMIMRNAMNGDTTMAGILKGLADQMSKTDPAQAKKLYDASSYMYNQSGTLGKTLFGPGIQGSFFSSAFNSGMNSYLNGTANSGNAATKSGLNYFKTQAEKAKFNEQAAAYNQNIYNPLVKDKYYEHNFYGALNNPMAQGALRYAMPWMAYGVPAAGAMSALGNNGLWLPVIGGGLASAAYGGAAGGGYIPNIVNSPFGQAIDYGVSVANQGPASVMGMSQATAPMGESITGPMQYGQPQGGGPVWLQNMMDYANSLVPTQNQFD